MPQHAKSSISSKSKDGWQAMISPARLALLLAALLLAEMVLIAVGVMRLLK